jgi:hypothetical protein
MIFDPKSLPLHLSSDLQEFIGSNCFADLCAADNSMNENYAAKFIGMNRDAVVNDERANWWRTIFDKIFRIC